MKQKQVKASPKVAKQAAKIQTPKKVKKVVEELEEEVVEKIDAKKPKQKATKVQKIPKKQVIVEPPVEDDEEEETEEEDDHDEQVEEQDDDASDDGAGEEEEEENNDEELEAENDDDDDEEEEEEPTEEEEPAEEAIKREEPTIPSKVKIGPIPPSVAPAKIIRIGKLPKNCKKIDIVEAFAKYGAIDQVYIVTSPTGTVAHVAFHTEKAALAAVSDNVVKVANTLVTVNIKSEKNNVKYNNADRTVYVKQIESGTTEEDLNEHFKSCGEIESISLKTITKRPTAFITFVDKSSIPAALKLDNSILNGGNIWVFQKKEMNEKPKIVDFSEGYSVTLQNKQNLKTIDVAKLEAIFSKCGEINNIRVVCKNVLAFINFKTEQAMQKAINLNGKVQDGLELEVEIYDPVKKWTSIFVTNLPKDCTVEDLTKIFSKAGEVVSVVLKKGFAVIRFADSDGYCKSFLYNETYIKGNAIFIEPHSYRKKTIFKSKKTFQNKGYKRSAANGDSVFKAKKAKIN